MSDKAEFLAYLPPIQTALTISGDGDLLQVKLNCNLSISPEAAKLLLMTGKKLKVTVETLTELDDEGKKDDETKESAERSGLEVGRRRRANRRDQRTGG